MEDVKEDSGHGNGSIEEEAAVDERADTMVEAVVQGVGAGKKRGQGNLRQGLFKSLVGLDEVLWMSFLKDYSVIEGLRHGNGIWRW